MKPLLYLLTITLFTITACNDKVTLCGEIGEIPNHFSPDGDGHEDHWSFDIRHMDSWEVSVYDRWGNPQYEAVNEPVKWNGALPDGEQAWVGTYVYTLKCQDGCGEKFEKQGTVTLIR